MSWKSQRPGGRIVDVSLITLEKVHQNLPADIFAGPCNTQHSQPRCRSLQYCWLLEQLTVGISQMNRMFVPEVKV